MKLIYPPSKNSKDIKNTDTPVKMYEGFSEALSRKLQEDSPRYILTREEADKLSLEELKQKIESNEEEIEKILFLIDEKTADPDFIDYAVSAASGLLCGILSCCISPEQVQAEGTEFVNKSVIRFAKWHAKKNGQDIIGDSEHEVLKEAVKYLEKTFPSVSDKATNEFGGGLYHHLREWSHHASILGLLSSLLIQLTGTAIGSDTDGSLKLVDIVPQGETFAERIILGTVMWLAYGVEHWAGHIISDMAGSSSSIANGKSGTGVPGPFISFCKELSALPIFKEKDENGNKKFSVLISKLFNGTLAPDFKMDLRTELGIYKTVAKKNTNIIIINDLIVRGFYLIRTIAKEIKDNSDLSGIHWDRINWKKAIKDPTLDRMITVSSGVMTAVSAVATAGYAAAAYYSTDPTVKAKATKKTAVLLCVTAQNGVRFAFALFAEAGNWYDREVLWQKLMPLQEEQKLLYLCYSEIVEEEKQMLEEENKKMEMINLGLRLTLSLLVIILFIKFVVF